jgi:CheY-like chemotaxis protein
MSTGTPSLKYRNIAVIDDDFVESYITERMIAIAAHPDKVKKYDSAERALLDFSKNKNRPEDLPDIIFLDINMPDMDGFDFLERFDNLDEKIKGKGKIVILSSSLNPRDYEKAISNKYVTRFLSKPLQLRDLDLLSEAGR